MDDVGAGIAGLVERVRAGDEAAARELVERLHPLVIRIVRGHLPRRGSEEELAQDIFVKMFAKLDQYVGPAPFAHWVSRIAVNHCRNAIRAQSARPEWRMADLSEEQSAALDAAAQSTSDQPDPTHAIAARELVEMLLESLAPPDRLVIQLLEIEDRSIEEIRRITGWSAGRVRVRAFRARQRLNRRFRQWRKAGGL
jgi:RNA polymerase sigma-70 factor (ECF subfamily)